MAYDEGLKEVRRQEIFQKLDGLVREAKELGVTAQELCGRIQEGEKHD